MTTEFFTPQERAALLRELKSLSDVDIVVYSRGTKEPLRDSDVLSDRVAFFAKAKLWRVVQGIIRAVFLEPMISGHLYLTNSEGDVFYLSKAHPSEQPEKSKFDPSTDEYEGEERRTTNDPRLALGRKEDKGDE